METALRNDWSQGVQNIYHNLLPIEKWAFKRQNQINPPYGTDQNANNVRLSRLGISGRHLPLKIAEPTKQVSAHHWKFSRCTPVRDMHTAFKLPYAYDIRITKLCMKQAEDIQNHENEHVRGIGQCEARHRKYEGWNFKSGNTAVETPCNGTK
jgi:hypothetical protein